MQSARPTRARCRRGRSSGRRQAAASRQGQRQGRAHPPLPSPPTRHVHECTRRGRRYLAVRDRRTHEPSATTRLGHRRLHRSLDRAPRPVPGTSDGVPTLEDATTTREEAANQEATAGTSPSGRPLRPTECFGRSGYPPVRRGVTFVRTDDPDPMHEFALNRFATDGVDYLDVRASAVLIGPGLALTARHNVESFSENYEASRQRGETRGGSSVRCRVDELTGTLRRRGLCVVRSARVVGDGHHDRRPTDRGTPCLTSHEMASFRP